MLDPWIIEEIRRREQEEEQQREQRPVLEIPLDITPYPGQGGRPESTPSQSPGPGEERGVTILDFSV